MWKYAALVLMTTTLCGTTCAAFSAFVHHRTSALRATTASTTTTTATATRSSSSNLHASSVVTVVVGGDLAGVAAALKIAAATDQNTQEVVLLTGHDTILQGLDNDDSILPDLTLSNRQLIERYANGGRELAGILAAKKQCTTTPRQLKEWLEQEQSVVLKEEEDDDDNDSTSMRQLLNTLLNEKPLFVSPRCDIKQVLQDNLERDGRVKIQTNVNITNISVCSSSGLFTIELEKNQMMQANEVVLAGDYDNELPPSILSTKPETTLLLDAFDTMDDDEPMSLKDRMKLEKKQQRYAKRLVAKRGQNRDRRRTLRKEKQVPTQQAENNEVSQSTDLEESTGRRRRLDTVALAQSLGHTIIPESPGAFRFLVPDGGPLEGCSSKEMIVPKARIHCKVETRLSKRRLPKVEGPLVISQNQVSGPAAIRLSTLIAHEMKHSDYRGTLQIHFAPDVGGVEDLEAALLHVADPTANVRMACPLVHREVDYDDYDVETGNFNSIELPLVPQRLWENLCRQAGIKQQQACCWKDLAPSTVQRLARLMVYCPFTITGIRPSQKVMAGGVCLKEINMKECQSQLVPGLFLCGSSTIDVHGFDGGFNQLASLATGHVAGVYAAAAKVAEEACRIGE